MSESNPFADRVPRTKGVSNTPKLAWSVAGIMALLAVVFLALWCSAQINHQDATALRAQVAETTTNLLRAQAENQKSQEQIVALQAQVAELEKEKEQEAHMAKGLEEEMRTDLESKDVTISQLQGKLTVNILDRIMFESGEAVLKPDGQAVMQKIAALLAKHPDLKIHVIGHTDNVPIRTGARGRFASNWELSAARALAAVHFLTDQAGVDSRRLGAVGYGEFRPIADNSTADGRAKNRRIAITILPDELAGADTVPTAKTPAVTNSLPVAAPAK